MRAFIKTEVEHNEINENCYILSLIGAPAPSMH